MGLQTFEELSFKRSSWNIGKFEIKQDNENLKIRGIETRSKL